LVVPSRTVLQDVNGNNYIYVLDRHPDDEAKARKVLVQRVSEYKGRISITPGELTGGELVERRNEKVPLWMKGHAKNVNNGRKDRKP
jgi:hypothetical protein